MKKLIVVCLAVTVFSTAAAGTPYAPGPATQAFAIADRVGEPNARSFFLLSTSVGSYIIRHDGMGEVTSPKGMRRVFNLKLAGKGRIERVYFLEHEGDLFLLYEVHDASSEWAYLVRMEQKQRKSRWVTSLESVAVQPPVIQGDVVIVEEARVRKTDGRLLNSSKAL